MPKDTPWDSNLSVTCDGEGLVGHAGTVLLRKAADRCGLTAALSRALARIGKFPQVDRSAALVSMAVAIVLGARSMRDIALLDHQAPVFGAPPSDTTVRRTLELADDRTLGKVAKARAKIRAHVWGLIAATPCTHLTSTNRPGNPGRRTAPGAGQAGASPGAPGSARCPPGKLTGHQG